MPRLALTTLSIQQELAEFARHVAGGLGALRAAGDLRPGVTPRTAVLRVDGVVLYRYGRQPAADAQPLLIVYALVNRPEMADLEAGRSLVAGLIAGGFDVYLIDWGYPTGAERLLGLDDYVNRYLDACVEHLRERLGLAALPLLGICQGGTFSACYAALNPHKVSRLVTTVTPIDFHTPDDMLSHLVRHIDVDALVASCGNVSGDLLNALFLSLKPYRLLQQKYLRLLEQLDDRAAVAAFLRMEHWIFDSPALTATACREFARDFYQANRLARGELRLRNLTMPVLNVYARDDHLVPPAASRALGGLIGTAAYTEAAISGGHIGIYVGGRSSGGVATLVQRWMHGVPLAAALGES